MKICEPEHGPRQAGNIENFPQTKAENMDQISVSPERKIKQHRNEQRLLDDLPMLQAANRGEKCCNFQSLSRY
jgi:hypothetical protein